MTTEKDAGSAGWTLRPVEAAAGLPPSMLRPAEVDTEPEAEPLTPVEWVAVEEASDADW